MAWIAAAILGAGALGAGASIFGSTSQVSAEQQAIQQQKQLYELGLTRQGAYLGDARALTSPFIDAGQGSLSWYDYLTGAGGAPAGSIPYTSTGPGGNQITIGGAGSAFNPLTAPLTAPFTAASLPSTPGYQFDLSQGLKSTQSGYAAEGLGSSGAALKGAASYATGLANNTYNSQLQNYLMQNQQIANMLLGGGQIGATAAETMAQLYGGAGNAALGGAVNTGSGVASSTAGIGNALAGGAAGVSGSIGNSLTSAILLSRLLGQNNPATPTSGPLNTSPYFNNALLSSDQSLAAYNTGGGLY